MKRLWIFSFIFLGACLNKEEAKPLTPEQTLIQRGRSTWASACASCHGGDPNKDGSLGPAVFGSSKELLEKRILKGTYPEGYVPKRKTKIMTALPHIKGELDALFAFLNHDDSK